MVYSDDTQLQRPHFRVFYNEYEASVGVDGEFLSGRLPIKQLKMVQAWAVIHEDELYIAPEYLYENSTPAENVV